MSEAKLRPSEGPNQCAGELIQSLAALGTPIPNHASMDFLREKSWWWRHLARSSNPAVVAGAESALMTNYGLDELHAEMLPTIMQRCQEFPAFVYELSVRIFAADRIPVPWLNLPDQARVSLISAFEPEPDWTGGAMVLSGEEPESGWTRPCGLSFRLEDSDAQLMQTFLDLVILPERKRLGIPNPGRKANKRRKNRGFSWRPIETLDKQRILRTSVTAGERSAFSKAKRKVMKLLPV